MLRLLLCLLLIASAAISAAGPSKSVLVEGRSTFGPNEEPDGELNIYLRLQERSKKSLGWSVEINPTDTEDWLRELNLSVGVARGWQIFAGRVPLPYRYVAPLPALLETADYAMVSTPNYSWGVSAIGRRGAAEYHLGVVRTSSRTFAEVIAQRLADGFEQDLSVGLGELMETRGRAEGFARLRYRFGGGTSLAGLGHVSEDFTRYVIDGEWSPSWRFTTRGAVYHSRERFAPKWATLRGGYLVAAGRPLEELAPWFEPHVQVEHHEVLGRETNLTTIGFRLVDEQFSRSLTLDTVRSCEVRCNWTVRARLIWRWRKR